MKYVVKTWRRAIEDAATLLVCAQAIAELARDGNQVAVVHGGGAAADADAGADGQEE